MPAINSQNLFRTMIAAGALAAVTFCAPAEAHGRHHAHHAYHRVAAHYEHHHARRAEHEGWFAGFDHAARRFVRAVRNGRPAAWCGWWMRQNVPGGDPGAAYNLARNWAHWGRPASGPAPGVIGVMPHHVFKVVEVKGPGVVLAISGNDGHTVRTRERSTRSVIAWREP